MQLVLETRSAKCGQCLFQYVNRPWHGVGVGC